MYKKSFERTPSAPLNSNVDVRFGQLSSQIAKHSDLAAMAEMQTVCLISFRNGCRFVKDIFPLDSGIRR